MHLLLRSLCLDRGILHQLIDSLWKKSQSSINLHIHFHIDSCSVLFSLIEWMGHFID
eukprot:c33693_g1_i1 orf=17-187(+)